MAGAGGSVSEAMGARAPPAEDGVHQRARETSATEAWLAAGTKQLTLADEGHPNLRPLNIPGSRLSVSLFLCRPWPESVGNFVVKQQGSQRVRQPPRW